MNADAHVRLLFYDHVVFLVPDMLAKIDGAAHVLLGKGALMNRHQWQSPYCMEKNGLSFRRFHSHHGRGEVTHPNNVIGGSQGDAQLLEIQPFKRSVFYRAVIEIEAVNVADGSLARRLGSSLSQGEIGPETKKGGPLQAAHWPNCSQGVDNRLPNCLSERQVGLWPTRH